ncbi:hypothetical protein, partial [Salmonella enterica]|uniref:hypothetical protein n=1 Tax=Salmonella enterica TaxID=28901 RepID=UPI00016BFA39
MKNQQTEKKIQKTLVQKNGIPIMRLHRHGGCESLHTNSRSVEEKILKFRVDSERGKRKYTPPRDGELKAASHLL